MTMRQRPRNSATQRSSLIHPTADVSPDAVVGPDTRVWHRTQIVGGASIGSECVIGSGVYVDRDVVIGNRVKIQTGAQLYRGATVEDGAFIGPLAVLTNDRYPRSINPDGSLQRDADWEQGRIHISYGASIGAGAVIVTGVTVGRFATVGAGAVVTADVPPHVLAIGVPARPSGFVCACGRRLVGSGAGSYRCTRCQLDYQADPLGGLMPSVPVESIATGG